MEQKKLAAIVGAVTACIEQEEQEGSVQHAAGSMPSSWRLFGRWAQMHARMNTGRVVSRSVRGGWRYFGWRNQ